MKTTRTKAIHLLLGLALTLGLMLCLTGPAMAAQLAFGSENNYTTVTNWTDLQDTISASSTTNPAYLKLGRNLTNPNAPLTIGSGNVVFLDLNGKTLSRGLSEAQTNGHVIGITDGGKLTIEDSSKDSGKITGGNTSGNGGGVYALANNAQFTMKGGTITGNTAFGDGGGVFLSGSSSFIMDGGTIEKNTGGNGSVGGGVYVSNGTLTMRDGTISGNKGGYGGGVNVGSNGTLAMIGGTISGNTATTYGGGIYLYDSGTQMTISGGTISDNTATTYGGGIYAGKSFTLQGTPTITDNTVNGNANNVYLNNFGDTSKIINIASNFTPSSSKIGVTLTDSSKVFTSNANYADDAAAQEVFISDSPAYEVYANNGQAALKAVPLNLWVGDDQVTGDNLSGTGWSFNPWTNTLTLDGYQYEGSGHNSGSGSYPQYGCIYYAGDKDFNLEIKGNNSLKNTNTEDNTRNSHGIYCTQNLTISGDGTLTTTSTGATGAMGINCNDYITIKSGTVEAKGNNYGINGQNGVTISGGSLKAEGYSDNNSYGINGTANETLTIGEGVTSVIISGTGKAVSGLSVNNAVKGFGWTDTAGKDAVIDIVTTGRELTYKKLQFPVYDVTFKVRGGAWNDGTTKDQTVTPDLDSNGKQILNQNDIPAVGARPSQGYQTGSWNVTPDTSNPITKNTTYVYSYAPKSRITRTVTFKVEHGAWDDGTTEDKTVTLTGYEGDTLKLKQDQIPAVGGKPDKYYKAGNWDTEPNPDTPITADTVYTYAYAKKPVIIPTLYFAAHVQNYGWDKENKTLEPGKSVDVGTTGRSLRMEALVLMVPEAFTVDGFVHVQDVGDLAVQEVKSSKDYTIPEGYHAYEFGTTGKSRRVEALCAALRNDDGDYVSGFQYAAHLQNYGWQGYVRNGSFAGTRGMALRMEAMRFAYAFPDVVPPGEPK